MTADRVRRWLPPAAVCSALGLFSALQMYALTLVKEDGLKLWQHLLWKFVAWQVWALGAVLIVELSRALPMSRKRFVVPALAHLALLGTLALTFEFVHYWCARAASIAPYAEYSFSDVVAPFLIKGMLADVFTYGVVLTLDAALDFQRRLREETVARAKVEAALVEAHLHALKMQLHPHFLFNTLNTISTLIRKGEGPGALKMLGGLADLLRRSLASMRVELVPMREELDFLQRYLDIETTRFSDRLNVVVDVDAEILDAQIPNLILQPIVENAIKHGLAPRAAGGQLEIAAHACTPDTLRVEVRDDGLGLKPGASPFGVGLSHVRDRLAQLYPGKHHFALTARQPQGAVAVLEIPLTRVSAALVPGEPR